MHYFKNHLQGLVSGIALAAILVLLPACNKEEVVPSKVSLLTNHGWQLTAWTSSPSVPLVANGTVVGTYSDLFVLYRAINSPCPLDQHFAFSPGTADHNYEYGAYSYQQGQAICGNQQRTHNGQWYEDDTSGKSLLYLQATTGNNNFNAIYTVGELSSNKLILSNRVQFAGSPTIYTYSYTFTAE